MFGRGNSRRKSRAAGRLGGRRRSVLDRERSTRVSHAGRLTTRLAANTDLCGVGSSRREYGPPQRLRITTWGRVGGDRGLDRNRCNEFRARETVGERNELTMRTSGEHAMKKVKAQRGAAAVELAMLLPVLIFCSLATVDFSRVCYVQVSLQSCAKTGHSTSSTSKPTLRYRQVGRAWPQQ